MLPLNPEPETRDLIGTSNSREPIKIEKHSVPIPTIRLIYSTQQSWQELPVIPMVDGNGHFEALESRKAKVLQKNSH